MGAHGAVLLHHDLWHRTSVHAPPALAGFAHRGKCQLFGRAWLFDSVQTQTPGQDPSNPLTAARSPFRVTSLPER